MLQKQEEKIIIITITLTIIIAILSITLALLAYQQTKTEDFIIKFQNSSCTSQGQNCELVSLITLTKDLYACKCNGKQILLQANGQQKKEDYQWNNNP